jgi:hypothetical protein
LAGSVVLLPEPEVPLPLADPEAEPLAEPVPPAEPVADLSVLLDEPLVLGAVVEDEPPEAEPELLGLDGLVVELEPLMPEDELEPGEERLVASLDEDDPALPLVASPPRSQPYRPPTAIASGRRMKADFLSIELAPLRLVGSPLTLQGSRPPPV